MDEPEAPPPHAGERLTREDVLRLIEEHGGPKGLDLSWLDLQEADLNDVNLEGAYLFSANLQETRLEGANLQGADLSFANLQRGPLNFADLRGAQLVAAELQGADLCDANLRGAHLVSAKLQGADLRFANLQGAVPRYANLQGANLLGANLQEADLGGADLRRARLAEADLRHTDLEGANWGDYVLGDEMAGDFRGAASAHRALKQRHTETGMYDIAGEFHYREMEARRKLAWKERRLPYALTMNALRFLYGYGEQPLLVIAWAAAVIFGLAFVYLLPGVLTGGCWSALYYSAVSFTALGYGWAAEPQGWAGRFLGVGESLLGVFMMALFLVTFTRKMTR